MADPATLVVVTGTGTDVGKTFVSRQLLRQLAASGLTCAARKPAQSFSAGETRTDADELAAATGEDPAVVCPPHRNYEVPMAPPMAADALDRTPILLRELAGEVARSWGPEPSAVGLVELAGGVRSPLAHDGDGVDMIAALSPQVVVLVADAGLGTINAVMTALDSLAPVAGGEATRVLVHLNRYDDTEDLHRRNRDWLATSVSPEVTDGVSELAGLLRAQAS